MLKDLECSYIPKSNVNMMVYRFDYSIKVYSVYIYRKKYHRLGDITYQFLGHIICIIAVYFRAMIPSEN